MFSFKAYLLRWMAATSVLAPHTAPLITPYIQASARAAVAQCTGGASQRACGLSWSSGVFDGTTGVGQQMAALSAVFTNLARTVQAPLTNSTGGTSRGNAAAGGRETVPIWQPQVNSRDTTRAGALTSVVLLGALFLFSWLSW